MSDQHDAGSLPELTPEQESDVRRLLAEARHDEPIPADVADRLDAALAGLTRDQPAAPGVAPVFDLAARRRRRNAAALLTGAAAVIVAGFAIGQAIDVGSSDSNDAAGSASSADRSAADSGKDELGSQPHASESDQSTAPAPADGAELPVVTLRSSHLRQDVTRQLKQLRAAYGSSSTQSAEAFGTVRCAPSATASTFGLGDLFPALFDGEPAVLALRPPVGGSQRADVLSCETAQPLDSVTLTLR